MENQSGPSAFPPGLPEALVPGPRPVHSVPDGGLLSIEGKIRLRGPGMPRALRADGRLTGTRNRWFDYDTEIRKAVGACPVSTYRSVTARQ